nr:MAG TPA: hypothetical protein [Caudoviricetes sp.]
MQIYFQVLSGSLFFPSAAVFIVLNSLLPFGLFNC